jgi:pimeloyl-ACP methyl ester carboxylesterase
MRPTRSVGSIIAGSLVAGLAAATALVAFPFAGAQEHVISGVVLLAFALGWALLAVLSARWTDQPQRWAAVPAGVLALAGAGLLAWPSAVLHDAIGWLWPPALLSLVAWMVVRVRRDLRSRARPWLLYPLFGVMALAAAAGAYETGRESSDRRAFPVPGQLVDVGGYRLHLRCTGAGSPTVVLLPGAGEFSPTWGWIAPAVARDARVCVHDRAGRGWSEAAPGPQDGVALAADLRTLLERAHVAGPYVLVGHSFGGLYALTFAARYPEQVAGVVLLDATHPEMFARVPAYPLVYEGYRRVSALFPSLARLGVGRLAYRATFDGLPPQARGEERAFWATARAARSQRDEWAEAPSVMRQARALRTLGARPLMVVTAGREAQPGWIPLQDELAALSTNSVHRVLPHAVHAELTTDKRDAALCTQAIRAVVEAVRSGKPMTRL